MTELRIGAAILREAIQTAEKEEDEGLKVRTAKAEEEMRKKRVCLLYVFTVDISSSGNSIFFLGFRQRKRFWMTARHRCSARSERKLSGTSNKRNKTHLSHPRQREQDVKSFLGVLFLAGSGRSPKCICIFAPHAHTTTSYVCKMWYYMNLPGCGRGEMSVSTCATVVGQLELSRPACQSYENRSR